MMLAVKPVAERLRISASLVYSWCEDHLLPHYRMGGEGKRGKILIEQAAADGKLGPSEWYAIAKAPEAEQQAMLAAKLAGASRDQLEQRGRKLRNGEAHGIKVNRLKIRLGSQGRSVTIAGSNLGLDDAIEILQEALKSARKAQGENLDGKTFAQVMKDKTRAGG
jgi:hypothetical protein